MIEKLNTNLGKILGYMSNPQDFHMRVEHVAKRLGVSKRTVYRLVESKELEAIRTSLRSIRISELSVVHYLERLNVSMVLD